MRWEPACTVRSIRTSLLPSNSLPMTGSWTSRVVKERSSPSTPRTDAGFREVSITFVDWGGDSARLAIGTKE